MSRGWSYSSGDNWINCSVCDRAIRASESRKRWDGLIVCSDDFEYRHEQEFIRVRADKITADVINPSPPDTFVTVNYVVPLGCSVLGSIGAADYSTSGCARAGILLQGQL